jgi:hypothetical protein
MFPARRRGSHGAGSIALGNGGWRRLGGRWAKLPPRRSRRSDTGERAPQMVAGRLQAVVGLGCSAARATRVCSNAETRVSAAPAFANSAYRPASGRRQRLGWLQGSPGWAGCACRQTLDTWAKAVDGIGIARRRSESMPAVRSLPRVSGWPTRRIFGRLRALARGQVPIQGR